MTDQYFLGIDTSNYRTSVALIDESGNVISSNATLLDVPPGKRGLRQSEAFFRHSERLPGYISDMFRVIDTTKIAAIGVSERPRRVDGSYMPCFMAGVNAAQLIASSMKVPVYRFSHQEGHAAAILESGETDPPERSLFFHLSGGTTEVLLCEQDGSGYNTSIIGGTLDISIGQLLDRYGVAMGYPFPSGKYLDDISFDLLQRENFDISSIINSGTIPKIRIKDGYFNLSGVETRLIRFAGSDDAKEHEAAVTAELFYSIAALLKNTAGYLSSEYEVKTIYMAGGVASSRSIRSLLSASKDIDIRFGDPSLSGDNAVGTALLAKRIHETGKRITGK